jgi:TRAP-type C4-dicarboxylate transport system permease small subunit
MREGKILRAVADLLEWAEHLAIRVLFLGLVVVVFGGVLLRYVFRIPLVWGEELAMFAFIWLAFLSAGVAVRRQAHFRMSALIDYLPARRRLFVEVATVLFMGALTLVLGWQGFHLATSGLHEQAPGLRVPMVWVYAALPISALSMLVFLFETLLVGPPPKEGA